MTLAAGLALACGCAPEKAELATVRGRVTRGGQPVAGAQLLFQPPGDRLATGTTDQDGHYQLSTIEQNDGALVSQHLVAIIHRPSISVAPTAGSAGPIPGAQPSESPTGNGWISAVPEKYSNSSAPEISVRVKPGTNTIDFDFLPGADATDVEIRHKSEP